MHKIFTSILIFIINELLYVQSISHFDQKIMAKKKHPAAHKKRADAVFTAVCSFLHEFITE